MYEGGRFIGRGNLNIDTLEPMHSPKVSFQITGQLSDLLKSPPSKL